MPTSYAVVTLNYKLKINPLYYFSNNKKMDLIIYSVFISTLFLAQIIYGNNLDFTNSLTPCKLIQSPRPPTLFQFLFLFLLYNLPADAPLAQIFTVLLQLVTWPFQLLVIISYTASISIFLEFHSLVILIISVPLIFSIDLSLPLPTYLV